MFRAQSGSLAYMKWRRGVIGDPLLLPVLAQFDFGNFLKMAAIVVAILVVAGVAGYAMYRHVEIALPTFLCRPLKASWPVVQLSHEPPRWFNNEPPFASYRKW
jgi:hypothetical protein